MTDIIERIHCDCTAEQCDYRDAVEEIKRLREALEKMQRGRDRYRRAWEAEKTRATRAALERDA